MTQEGVPGVAVIVPVHNGERYVREALESVLAQGPAPEEVVAVDDGSTDGTPGVLAGFGTRVRVVRIKNAGVGAARNAGLRAAASPYAAFLDADDRWRPGKLARFHEAARSNPDAVLFFSDAVTIGPEGEPRGSLRRAPQTGPLYPQLFGENFVVTSTAVVRREAALAAGGFREDFLCKAGVEDWEFFLRLCRRGPWHHAPEALTEYRVHPGSAIQTKRFNLKKDALRVLDLQADAPEWTPALQSLGRARVHFDSGVRHLAAGDGAEARADFRASARHPRFLARSAALFAASFLGPSWIEGLRRLRRGLA